MSLRDLSASELIARCVSGSDAAAWEEFIHRFHPLIVGVALKTARRWCAVTPDLLQDLVQETYLRICSNRCRVLRDFRIGDSNAIYGYLKVVTGNLVNDCLRANLANKRGASATVASTDENVGIAEDIFGSGGASERQLVLSEVSDFLRTKVEGGEKSRDWQIFWLYYRQGYTARDIAALRPIGLTQKGVEAVILRLTRLVKVHFAENISRPVSSLLVGK